jgi:hypothetical protein
MSSAIFITDLSPLRGVLGQRFRDGEGRPLNDLENPALHRLKRGATT